MLQTVFCIIVYYVSSIFLGFFTSHILSANEYNFPYPIFITAWQNFMHYFFALILIKIQSFLHKFNKKRKNLENHTAKLKHKVNYYKVIPCAISASIDIALSSFAFKHVSYAFYTMVKSSAPVFILFNSFLFQIEKPSYFNFFIIVKITVGIFLTTLSPKTTQLTFLASKKDFLILILASFMSGFRWAFVQYIIRNEKKQSENVLYSIRDLCLPISIFLMSISLFFERSYQIPNSSFFQTGAQIQKNIIIILISGSLSFILLLSEFVVVKNTSVIILSLSGIFKEILIIVTSIFFKRIILGPINYLGLCLSSIGILLYGIYRN